MYGGFAAGQGSEMHAAGQRSSGSLAPLTPSRLPLPDAIWHSSYTATSPHLLAGRRLLAQPRRAGAAAAQQLHRCVQRVQPKLAACAWHTNRRQFIPQPKDLLSQHSAAVCAAAAEDICGPRSWHGKLRPIMTAPRVGQGGFAAAPRLAAATVQATRATQRPWK